MFVTLNRACFEFYGCKDRNVSWKSKIHVDQSFLGL